jgi:small subunit ribosomal protein S8e
MTKWNMKSKRKKTSGLLKRGQKKKKYQRGRDFLEATVGERKLKIKKVRGSGIKRILLSVNIANVIVDGKAQKTKILAVVDNKADSHFIRRNVVTKGAIINTNLGKARVTSRPGQEGNVNAILIEETPSKKKA